MTDTKLELAIEAQRFRNLTVNTAHRLDYAIMFDNSGDVDELRKPDSVIARCGKSWHRYWKPKNPDNVTYQPFDFTARSVPYKTAYDCMVGELYLGMKFKPGQVVTKAKRGIKRFTVLPLEAQTSPDWVIVTPSYCKANTSCNSLSFNPDDLKLVR